MDNSNKKSSQYSDSDASTRIHDLQVLQKELEMQNEVLRLKSEQAESAEEALQMITNRLSRAELASKSGNWELHLDTQIIVTSTGAEKVYGLEKGKMGYKDIKKCALPQYRPKLDEAMTNLIEKDAAYDVEFKIKTADSGTLKAIHSIATFDKEKRIVFGVIQDISERKKMEETLLEREGIFKTLNNLTSEMLGIKELDDIYELIAVSLHKRYPDTIILYNSVDEDSGFAKLETLAGLETSILSKFMKIAGYNPVGRRYKLTPIHNEYFKSGEFVEFKGGLAEFSADEISAYVMNVIEKVIGINKIYTIGINKDDSLLAAIHFFTFNNQVINDKSFIEMFVKQSGLIIQKKMDKNALMKSEERLIHSHDMMKYIIEHNSTSIAVFDRELRFVYVSQSFMLDYNPKSFDIIGKHQYDVFPDVPQRWRDIHQKALSGEILSAEDDPYVREDGTVDWTKWECRPWYESDGSIGGIIVYTELITKRKQMEENLRKKIDELAIVNLELEKYTFANQELKQFAYTASHQLQEPIRTVSNYTQIIEEDYSALIDEEGLKHLHTIRDATKRIAGLIDSLMEFSRLGRNKKLVYVNCNLLVKSVIADLEALITKSNAEIKVDEMPELYIYEVEIRQLFQNLITNAIKFQHRDSRAKIHIWSEKLRDKWKFFVRDNGIGIAAEHYKRIFDIFQRLHRDEDVYEGKGIGLAYCKKIVEMHQGEIWVESKLEEGATFTFTIPNLLT